MANDADEILIAPGGTVYAAPVGTAEPINSTVALNAAFVDLGYVSEDGVQFTVGSESEPIPAWQALYPVRRLVTGRTAQAEFALRQWNADTVKLAFGGGEVTEVSAGQYKYTPPGAADALDERCVIIEWADGDRDYRVVVPRCIVIDEVETQLVRSAAADLPITLEVLGSDAADPWYLLSSDVAMSPS